MLLKRLLSRDYTMQKCTGRRSFTASSKLARESQLARIGMYGIGLCLSLYTWNRRFCSAETKTDESEEDVKVVPLGESVRLEDHDSFSVVQFNILAGNLASPRYFPYVEPSKLEWTKRRALIISNAISHDPDILCIEELNDYWVYFKNEFYSRGYESIYLKRPSLHYSSRSGKEKADGCGIFYRSSKFQLEEHQEINYVDIHDRVALAILLKNKITGKHVIIVSTHLYWDPREVAVQIGELNELDETLFRTKANWEKKHSIQNTPIVIGGDFNNTPSSPLYQHMMQKFGLQHGTQFRSAYHSYPALEAGHVDAPHTSCTHKRCCTIDFLWYSSASLRVTSLGEIPSAEKLRSEEGPKGWVPEEGEVARGIPNSKFGSDHIPLFASFRRIEDDTKN